jgi:hypothetical protein
MGKVTSQIMSKDMIDSKNKANVDAGSLNNRVGVVETSLADIAYNVKTYGAKGDGVTDDTASINNALATGNPIYFPKGVYLCSGQLNWSGKNDIKGAGLIHTTIKCTSSTGSIINSDTTAEDKYGTISDLTLDGSDLTPIALSINAGKGISVKRFKAKNYTSKGILVGSGTNQTWETTLIDITLRGSDGTVFPDYGIYVGSSATDNTFHNCMVANSKISQFYDSGGNNMFSLCHGYCYPITKASNYTFECRGIGGSFNQCYSDTPSQAGFYVKNYNITLSNIKVYFPVSYTVPTTGCYPVKIDNTTGTVTGISIFGLTSHADGVSSVDTYDIFVVGQASSTWRVFNTVGNFTYKWERVMSRGIFVGIAEGATTISFGTAFPMTDNDFLIFATPNWDYGYIKQTAKGTQNQTFVTTNPAPVGGGKLYWQILQKN